MDSPARIEPEEAAIGRPAGTARRLVEASVSENTRRSCPPWNHEVSLDVDFPREMGMRLKPAIRSSAPCQDRFAPKQRLWAALALAIAASACAHVHPYPVTVEPPEYPLVVAPVGVTDWDRGLADQLHATSKYCARVRHAVVREAEQRRDRAATMKTRFAVIGGLAGLALAAYRDTVDAPKDVATVTLSLFTGGSLVGAVAPLFDADERLERLREKVHELDEREAAVVDLLQTFERQVLERSHSLDEENTAANRRILTGPVLQTEERFRSALIAWRRECE